MTTVADDGDDKPGIKMMMFLERTATVMAVGAEAMSLKMGT
jgi:hypothetical protein